LYPVGTRTVFSRDFSWSEPKKPPTKTDLDSPFAVAILRRLFHQDGVPGDRIPNKEGIIVRTKIAAALFAALTSASLASAQFPSSSGTSYKSVNTSKHLAAPAAQQSGGFFGKFLPKISLPGFSKSTAIGPGPLPSKGSVPATAKNPFQPLAPFTPKK
jgi:hypothetical protein